MTVYIPRAKNIYVGLFCQNTSANYLIMLFLFGCADYILLKIRLYDKSTRKDSEILVAHQRNESSIQEED